MTDKKPTEDDKRLDTILKRMLDTPPEKHVPLYKRKKLAQQKPSGKPAQPTKPK